MSAYTMEAQVQLIRSFTSCIAHCPASEFLPVQAIDMNLSYHKLHFHQNLAGVAESVDATDLIII